MTAVEQVRERSVVVGVDGSSGADHAVSWAADDAARRGLALMLLHAADPIGTANAVWMTTAAVDAVQMQHDIDRVARTLLTQTAARVHENHPDLEVETVHQQVDPREALISASTRAESVVVGSRGRGPVASLVLGSVSASVVKHAACPVTVVRPTRSGGQRLGVLAGIDCEEPEAAVLEAAYTQAEARGLPLTVMHCFWDVLGTTHASRRVPDDDRSVDDLRLLVAEATAGMAERYPDVDVRPALARGFTEELLSRESGHHDLVVVGHHRSSGLSAFLHGSIATAVVERASAPVLVVPVVTEPKAHG